MLAVAMVDGSGLAAHLGGDALGYAPREMRGGIMAMAVDPGAALEEYLRLQLHLPILGPAGRALRVFAETVPGIRDTVVMGKVLFEARGGGWDAVVVDGPPTGQVLSYLRAPATIEGLVPAGRVRTQAAWMRQLLADAKRAGLIVVATAEELPVTEAVATLEALAAEPLCAVTALAANRVLPEPGFTIAQVSGLPPGPARRAARLHLDLRESQAAWLARLGDPLLLPHLFGVHTPPEVSARLADLWEGPW